MLKSIKSYVRSSFLFDRYGPFRQQIELIQWKLVGKPVPIPHWVKQQAIKQYAKQFSLNVLVETGTYLGTMINATKDNFHHIYSIELDHELYVRAQKRFARFPHITLFKGDSSDVLPVILRQISSPALFWLDGHYSGGITAKGTLDTPIMQELRHILEHPVNGHVILIDDARDFTGQHDYPLLEELDNYVRSHFSDHIVEVRDDMIRILPKLEQ